MQLRILTAQDVADCLPMPDAIEAMRVAFGQLSAGRATMPLRASLSTPKGVTLIMPARLDEGKLCCIKVASIYNDNADLGLPVVTATVLVLDSLTGLPKALMDGSALTAIRSGAAGGLAADLLARKSATTVALFGAGVQARAQLRGLMAVRKITQVNLLSRTEATARQLADEISTWPDSPTVRLAAHPRQALADADVVIAATTSATPVFNGNDVRPGMHITGVGSFLPEKREVDEVAVMKARVVVDSREACLAEAGDIIIPGTSIDAELGEIVNGTKPGRQSDEEITFFKSVGVAVQDAAAVEAVLARAQADDRGTMVLL